MAADVLVTLSNQFNLIYILPPMKLLPSLLNQIEMEGILVILICVASDLFYYT